MKNIKNHQLLICIENNDYPTSLEKRKIYQAIPDEVAAQHGQVRVIDESGEDYLYPEEYFVPVCLPKNIEDAVIQAAG